MTCTCTHPIDAHVIVGMRGTDMQIIQPCQVKDCPCENFVWEARR